jgi:CBS domain-containing protein
LTAGHSRIPIYLKDRQNVIGVLIVKQLLLVDPDDATPIREVMINPIFRVSKETLLFDLLHLFEQGGSHMALVVDEQESSIEIPTLDHVRVPSSSKSPLFPYKNALSRLTASHGNLLGIVTLEDVIEELLGQEIIDETDVYIDVQAGIKVTRRRSPSDAEYPADTPIATDPPPLNSSMQDLDSDDETNEHSKLLSKSKTKIYEETSRILTDWLSNQTSQSSLSSASSSLKPPPPLIPSLKSSQDKNMLASLKRRDSESQNDKKTLAPFGSNSVIFKSPLLGPSSSAPGTPKLRSSQSQPSHLLSSLSRMKLGKELIPAEMLATVVLANSQVASPATNEQRAESSRQSNDFDADHVYV